MKAILFDELIQSVREGGAILRGQKRASRRFVIEASGVRAIREKTALSQPEFAHLIGVSVKTLQNWEQDRRSPTGPAAALLRIISSEPQLAIQAIHRP
ncbi:MAG: helix-turn-helix domain-containing protein [Bryobacteraceae bacterium]|nr:helix-turn-helix domain-containing protein [Bryobacteraceae bacterium]